VQSVASQNCGSAMVIPEVDDSGTSSTSVFSQFSASTEYSFSVSYNRRLCAGAAVPQAPIEYLVTLDEPATASRAQDKALGLTSITESTINCIGDCKTGSGYCATYGDKTCLPCQNHLADQENEFQCADYGWEQGGARPWQPDEYNICQNTGSEKLGPPFTGTDPEYKDYQTRKRKLNACSGLLTYTKPKLRLFKDDEIVFSLDLPGSMAEKNQDDDVAWAMCLDIDATGGATLRLGDDSAIVGPVLANDSPGEICAARSAVLPVWECGLNFACDEA